MQLFYEGEKMKNFILFFLFLLSTITIGASKRKPAEVDPQDYGKHSNTKKLILNGTPFIAFYIIMFVMSNISIFSDIS